MIKIAAGTSVLQEFILTSIPLHVDLEVIIIQAIWSNLCMPGSQSETVAHSQKSLDNRVTQAVHTHLLENAADGLDKSRLLAVSAPHSGDWLNAKCCVS